MGANQSTEQSNNKSENDYPPGHFEVSVSGKMIEKGILLEGDLEQKIQEAYQRGKEEGLATIQQSLNAVAAQTYDQIYKQLSDIQSNELQNSKDLVNYFYYKILNPKLLVVFYVNIFQALKISERIAAPIVLDKSCGVEELDVVNCFSSNPKSSLKCSEVVDAYISCANNALQV